MNSQVIDHPNLYFSAHLFINNILSKLSHPVHDHSSEIQYQPTELRQVLHSDDGESNIHLEAIIDLLKSYVITTPHQSPVAAQPIVDQVLINGRDHTVTVSVHQAAKQLVKQGAFTINPTY